MWRALCERKIMLKKKYGIRFPEIRTMEPLVPISVFSEQFVREAEDTFVQTFDVLHSLTNYVIEKNRTQNLGEQLNARRTALDTQMEQAVEQGRIALREYTEQLQIRLKAEKEQMELDVKALSVKVRQMVDECSVTAEEAIRENQLWLGMIQRQQNFLNSIQPYIEQLKDDYVRRKEYIQYCDMQRKAFGYIEGYLREMV